MDMLPVAIVVAAVVSYLIGGINGAIVISALRYGDDIRTQGSGNAGFTNFRRVHGMCASTVLVFVIDILKTVMPVLCFALLFDNFFGYWSMGAAVSAVGCVFGHCYPIWYGFKGGKGMLATLTAIWFIDYRMAVVATAIFVLVLLLFNFMSLASCIGVCAAPIAMIFIGFDSYVTIAAMAVIAVVVVIRHRSNIRRLINGDESKFFKKHLLNSD